MEIAEVPQNQKMVTRLDRKIPAQLLSFWAKTSQNLPRVPKWTIKNRQKAPKMAALKELCFYS
jgi:hypothetical protein